MRHNNETVLKSFSAAHFFVFKQRPAQAYCFNDEQCMIRSISQFLFLSYSPSTITSTSQLSNRSKQTSRKVPIHKQNPFINQYSSYTECLVQSISYTTPTAAAFTSMSLRTSSAAATSTPPTQSNSFPPCVPAADDLLPQPASQRQTTQT